MAPPTTGKHRNELEAADFGQVEQLFATACRLPAEERERFLQNACEEDSVRAEVLTLLQYDAVEGDSFDDTQLSSQRGASRMEATYRAIAPVVAGTVLGDYRLEKEIGRGGMAIVFRARQLSQDREVAVKVLSIPLPTASVRERFRREAKVCRLLDHEAIVQVIDYAEENHVAYYAMELIEGQTLEQLLPADEQATYERHARQRSEQPPYQTECRWIAEAARGLAHAHAQGIFHRDIKPANLIVTPEGKVKILDFGVAKLRPGSTLTITGAMLGTPRYMSPEQFSNEKRLVDYRTDVYSLGATFYQLLTLRPLFECEDIGQLANVICNSEPATPRSLNPDIPVVLERICLKAMAKDPSERHQQAGELADDLEAYLAGQAVVVKTASWPKRLASALRRHRSAATWLAAVVPIALLASLLLRPAAKPTELALVNQRFITSDRGYNSDPAISANGEWLAFMSDKKSNGDANIWLQQLYSDGSKRGESFRVSLEAGDESEPAVSPDGKLVAYVGNSGGEHGIHVRAIEAGKVGEPKFLCPKGRGPRFSPDGKWIAYWRGPGGRTLDVRGDSIWVIPATGGAPRRLCPELYLVARPVWSPDGNKLLFCGVAPPHYNEGGSGAWWVVSLQGGQAEPIDIEPVLSAHGIALSTLCVPSHWTPETNAVVFSAWQNERFKLWSLPLEPDTLQMGPLKPLSTGGSQEIYAQVSSKERICFDSIEYDFGIWELDADSNQGVVTGSLQVVADNPAVDNCPSATRSGGQIVFSTNRRGQFDIYSVVEDGEPTDLIEGPDAEGQGVISAAGDKLAFFSAPRSSYQLQPPFASFRVANLLNGKVDPSSTRELKIAISRPLDWHTLTPARYLLVLDSEFKGLQLIDTETEQVERVLRRQDSWIQDASFSADGNWLTLAANRSQNRQVFVVRFDLETTEPPTWIPITDGTTEDYAPDWSPDGKLVYYLSDRLGRPSVWCQPVEPQTKQPVGSARLVYEFAEYRRSPIFVGSNMCPLTVLPDRLLFCLGNCSSNVLVADLVPH